MPVEWYYPTGASGPVPCAWAFWLDGEAWTLWLVEAEGE